MPILMQRTTKRQVKFAFFTLNQSQMVNPSTLAWGLAVVHWVSESPEKKKALLDRLEHATAPDGTPHISLQCMAQLMYRAFCRLSQRSSELWLRLKQTVSFSPFAALQRFQFQQAESCFFAGTVDPPIERFQLQQDESCFFEQTGTVDLPKSIHQIPRCSRAYPFR
jgi:hypothetical protein